MHRSAKRLASLLACAAVPVMLVAGCSSDSDKKDSGDSGKSAAPSASASASGSGASPSPSVAPAKFKKLPDPCQSVSKDTINKLLPKADEKGKAGKTSDAAARAYCSWTSSEDQGVDGTQYRWLDIGFQRYDSSVGLGTGDKRATDAYNRQVDTEKGVEGAKNVKADKTGGIGDEATSITFDSKENKNDFKNQTVVARTANVVVTVHFKGSGLAGGDSPDAEKMLKDAQNTAKEAVASVAKANQ